MAIGPLFSASNNFSWVGIGCIQETTYKKPNPTKILREHLIRKAITPRKDDLYDLFPLDDLDLSGQIDS